MAAEEYLPRWATAAGDRDHGGYGRVQLTSSARIKSMAMPEWGVVDQLRVLSSSVVVE
jgi:hypothetical protein